MNCELFIFFNLKNVQQFQEFFKNFLTIRHLLTDMFYHGTLNVLGNKKTQNV